MKKKRAWLPLCAVAIAGILCAVILRGGSSKSEIFDYVQENQADLERFAAELMRVNGQDAKYKDWPVSYYEDARTVEFLTKGSGLGSATTKGSIILKMMSPSVSRAWNWTSYRMGTVGYGRKPAAIIVTRRSGSQNIGFGSK